MTRHEVHSWALGLFMAVIIGVAAVTMWPGRPKPMNVPKPDAPPSELAQKINSACRAGYHVYDFQIGGGSSDYDASQSSVPDGYVKVTCVRYGKDGSFDQYPTVVER